MVTLSPGSRADGSGRRAGYRRSPIWPDPICVWPVGASTRRRTARSSPATAYLGLSIQPLAGGKAVAVEIPEGGRPDTPVWSPQDKRFALAVTFADRIDLYLGKPGSASLQKVNGLRLNAAMGRPIHWLGDGKTLVVQAIDPARGKPPTRLAEPAGPVIQQSRGKAAPRERTRICSKTSTTRSCSTITAPPC